MTDPVRYDSLNCKTALNAVKAPSMPFEWSLNPYRGCRHGCSFCYARSTHAFLGLDADDTFQNRILVKANAPEALEAQLEKMARSGKLGKIGQVAIGTATDPYQQVEGRARVTRACLDILARYRVPVSITTRSPLILRDVDVLKRSSVVSVNISINTLDQQVWRNMEPYSPSPAKRMEAVGRLAAEGIPTGIFLAPLLPFLTDGPDGLERLIGEAAETEANFVMASFLRLGTREVRYWFFRTLEQKYPALVRRYAELYAGTAYAAEAYREPVMRTIRRLLRLYGLPDIDAFYNALDDADIRAAAGRPPETDDPGGLAALTGTGVPLQLEFDFGGGHG